MPSDLHPVTEPYSAGWLAVGGGHRIHWQQYGRPDRPALLWLHGGPGGATSARQVRQFDPAVWRIVVLDQRGCGASQADDDCCANTTPDLIGDIEALRTHIGVTDWLVCGGSWGATLALGYAAAHRQAVRGLLLRNVFLASSREMYALFAPPAVRASGAFAEARDEHAWHVLLDALGSDAAAATPAQRLAIAYRRLNAPDASAAQDIALAWAGREAVWTGDAIAAGPDTAALLRRYRVHAHYLVHGAFLDVDDILATIGMHPPPAALIHGEDDRLCPAENTARVQEHLPGSRSMVIAGAGHSPFDPGMQRAWQHALDAFAATGRFDGWGRP